MDSHAVHTAEKVQQLLRSHCAALRRDPFLQKAWLVVVYEKNTGFESGHNWKITDDFQPAYSIFQNKVDSDKARDTADQDPGIDTNFYLKNEYARVLNEALRQSKIYFYRNWVCANPWLRPMDSRKAITKKALIVQLANCRLQLPSMDPSRARVGVTLPKITWSGKIGSNGKEVHGQNDDLVMSAAQCFYWIARVHQMNYPGFPYDTIFPNVPHRRVITTKH